MDLARIKSAPVIHWVFRQINERAGFRSFKKKVDWHRTFTAPHDWIRNVLRLQ